MPTQAELLAAYPSGAVENHTVGEVMMTCGRDAHGVLDHCRVAWEYPEAAGFGRAALSVADKFRVDLASPAARQSVISIPMLFAAASPSRPARPAVFPKKKKGFERTEPAGPYWPELALRAGVGGIARIDCKVADDNRLKDCLIADDAPIGAGFVFATLKMAEVGWMIAGPAPEGAAPPPDGYWRFELVYPRRTLADAAH